MESTADPLAKTVSEIQEHKEADGKLLPFIVNLNDY